MMAGAYNSAAAGLVLSIAVLMVLPQVNGQLMFGFSELDYTRLESQNGTGILVIKRSTNVGDLVLTIRALTVSQYDQMFGCDTLPNGISCTDIDPAEFDPQGKQDFVNDEIQVTFPPTTNSEDSIGITIPFINDDTNEAQESFFLVASIDQVLSDQADITNAQAIRNGVAQVNINNDDLIALTFEMPDYAVSEDAGEVNDLVFVIKEDGRNSEQILPILVQLSAAGEATENEDFVVPNLILRLEFEPTVTRLAINMTIFDDQILEPSEDFTLVLSVPLNPPIGFMLGTLSSTTIHIDDNEQGRVGVEQTEYTANESDGTVEICFVIFEPSNTSLLDTNAFVEFGWQTNNGTALGEGVDFDTVVDERVFLSRDTPRMCSDITLNDDAVNEDIEQFSLNVHLADDLSRNIFGPTFEGNFVIDPDTANVSITDNDGSGNETTVNPPTTTDNTGGQNESTTQPTTTMGGDPHYSILLPSGQNLCYSVQGEHGFTFNLISNKRMQMNAMFVPDARREEVTWIGVLGIVLKNVRYRDSNKTRIRFVASENKLHVGEHMSLNVESVERLEFSNGKLKVSEAVRKKGAKRLDVEVDLKDIGLKFTVRFVKKCHLDMFWNQVDNQPRDSHGMIGQFFRYGVEIDETRRLLLLPAMEPVPVMRKPVWHFMEREVPEDSLCWVAMNPGYQGKKLLEGHYLDYLVNDVLSSKFKFSPKK